MIPGDELDRLDPAVDRAMARVRNGEPAEADAELRAGLQRAEKCIYDALVADELEDWMPELVRR